MTLFNVYVKKDIIKKNGIYAALVLKTVKSVIPNQSVLNASVHIIILLMVIVKKHARVLSILMVISVRAVGSIVYLATLKNA